METRRGEKQKARVGQFQGFLYRGIVSHSRFSPQYRAACRRQREVSPPEKEMMMKQVYCSSTKRRKREDGGSSVVEGGTRWGTLFGKVSGTNRALAPRRHYSLFRASASATSLSSSRSTSSSAAFPSDGTGVLVFEDETRASRRAWIPPRLRLHGWKSCQIIAYNNAYPWKPD